MNRILTLFLATTIAAAPAPLLAQKVDEIAAKKAKPQPAKPPAKKAATPTKTKKKGVLDPALEKQQKK